MNIILKSFDGNSFDKPIIERAFSGLKINTCISIANSTELLPKLDAKEHIWMNAKLLRAGRYPDVNWNEITPLDEEIIERMRHCEAMFMTMIDRYAFPEDIPFHERKRQYFEHLRFWNHTLDARNIDLVLMNHVPHQCYDYVIYCLCHLKGIPTPYLERNLTTDGLFIVEDWEKSAVEIRDRYRELQKEYQGLEQPIPLSQNSEFYYNYYQLQRPIPWYTPELNRDTRRSFATKWTNKAVHLIFRDPLRFVGSILSSSFWKRKLSEHRMFRLYDHHASVQSLSAQYFYLPLHFQPESSTNPIAGAYVDQEHVVQLVAACLPSDVLLYVKEHPRQGERCRSERFYKALLDIPSVRFIPRNADTYQLTDNAVAVVTGTGTVLPEAIVRRKPSLMFGHFIYQYGPGVLSIRTLDDCRTAVEKILRGEIVITEKDVRLFFKAIEDCSTPYIGRSSVSPHQKMTNPEKAQLIGERIGKSIRSHWKE